MGIFKTTVAVLVSGFLVGAASMPARAGESKDPPGVISAEVMPAEGAVKSLLGVLNSIQVESTPDKERRANCKAQHLYSEHDVVGDPQACFLGNMGPGIVIGGPG
jgi:hypothetical protein